MVNKDKYLNHIRDPEIKKTINKFIDSLRSLRNEYVTVVTDFMNPKEMEYAEIIMKDMPDVPYAIYGMVEDAERQVMLLGYERNMPFQYLSILEISNPSDDVTHQDVLGSVLHLGIERSKVGDIIISDKIYVVVQNTICDFLLAEWKKIRRHRIEVRMAEEKKIPYSDVEYETTTVIVSSCRLDGLIHAVCHIPRSKAGDMIRAGMVKVNYEQVTSRSLAVPDQSLISVRRWGRFIFEKVLQETKKEKAFSTDKKDEEKMIGLWIIILSVIIDHVTKYFAISLRQGDIPLIGHFLKLSYVENRGAAFGIFQNKKLFLNSLTVFIIIYLIYFLMKHMQEMNRWTIVGFSLVIGGAFGNLIDRLFRGYVIDFISVTFPGGYAFPVFNVADMCVVIGTAGILISVLFLKEKVLL